MLSQPIGIDQRLVNTLGSMLLTIVRQQEDTALLQARVQELEAELKAEQKSE